MSDFPTNRPRFFSEKSESTINNRCDKRVLVGIAKISTAAGYNQSLTGGRPRSVHRAGLTMPAASRYLDCLRPPSSSGPGFWILSPATGVQIPLGVPTGSSVPELPFFWVSLPNKPATGQSPASRETATGPVHNCRIRPARSQEAMVPALPPGSSGKKPLPEQCPGEPVQSKSTKQRSRYCG